MIRVRSTAREEQFMSLEGMVQVDHFPSCLVRRRRPMPAASPLRWCTICRKRRAREPHRHPQFCTQCWGKAIQEIQSMQERRRIAVNRRGETP